MFIKNYKKERNKQSLEIVDFVTATILTLYTIIFSIIIDVWLYLILFGILCLISFEIKCSSKLYIVYDYNMTLYIETLNLIKVNKLYKQKVNIKNKAYVYENLKVMTKKQIDIFYSYLCNTKNSLQCFKFKDIILMGISFAIGASFDDTALIKTELLSNALSSVIGCFLGLAPIYIIIYKTYIAYIKLYNDDVAKSELIEFINDIVYEQNSQSVKKLTFSIL